MLGLLVSISHIGASPSSNDCRGGLFSPLSRLNVVTRPELFSSKSKGLDGFERFSMQGVAWGACPRTSGRDGGSATE